MASTMATQAMARKNNPMATRTETAAIFGLRYLEEEAAEIQDVIGCFIREERPDVPTPTGSGCDDSD